MTGHTGVWRGADTARVVKRVRCCGTCASPYNQPGIYRSLMSRTSSWGLGDSSFEHATEEPPQTFHDIALAPLSAELRLHPSRTAVTLMDSPSTKAHRTLEGLVLFRPLMPRSLQTFFQFRHLPFEVGIDTRVYLLSTPAVIAVRTYSHTGNSDGFPPCCRARLSLNSLAVPPVFGLVHLPGIDY